MLGNTEQLYGIRSMTMNIPKIGIKDYLNELTLCVDTITHLGSQKVHLNEVPEHKNL